MSQTRAVRYCPPPPRAFGMGVGAVQGAPWRCRTAAFVVWGHRHFDGTAEGGPSEVVAHWPLSSAFLRPFLFGFFVGERPTGPRGPLLFRSGPYEARPPLPCGRHPRRPHTVLQCGAGTAPVRPRGRIVS